MQTKNTIKQLVFLFMSLLLAEGVFGFGLYWPFLLSLKDRRWSFWLAFFCGLILSVLYSQKIGLMSLFLVAVVTVVYLFMSTGRGFGKMILPISIVVNLGFDYLFGLHWSMWEVLLLVIVCFWFGRDFERAETIKINL